MPPAGGFFMSALALVSISVFYGKAAIRRTVRGKLALRGIGVLQRDRSNLAKFIADDNKLLRAWQLI